MLILVSTLISWAFLPSFICFSIWGEYLGCASLRKKDLQLLLTDKSGGWKMLLVILFGMAHVLPLDHFISVTTVSVQWALNTSAISSHCWSSGRHNFCLTFLTYGTNISLVRSRLVFSFAQWFCLCDIEFTWKRICWLALVNELYWQEISTHWLPFISMEYELTRTNGSGAWSMFITSSFGMLNHLTSSWISL